MLIGTLLFWFRKMGILSDRHQQRRVCGLVLAVFILLNLAYWQNIIPPVPLALKSGGIYHRVQKINGDYTLTYETPHWTRFWAGHDSLYLHRKGDRVYCFASVFAPTGLSKKITHRWQWKDPQTGDWKTWNKLGYAVTGGRDGGFRGYTYKKNIRDGAWRVDVITDEGWVLGRIGFRIKTDSRTTPRLLTTVVN